MAVRDHGGGGCDDAGRATCSFWCGMAVRRPKRASDRTSQGGEQKDTRQQQAQQVEPDLHMKADLSDCASRGRGGGQICQLGMIRLGLAVLEIGEGPDTYGLATAAELANPRWVVRDRERMADVVGWRIFVLVLSGQTGAARVVQRSLDLWLWPRPDHSDNCSGHSDRQPHTGHRSSPCGRSDHSKVGAKMSAADKERNQLRFETELEVRARPSHPD